MKSDAVLTEVKGRNDENAVLGSSSGAGKHSSLVPTVPWVRTGNGHASQNGEDFDQVDAKLEFHQVQTPHVVEQELLDGWANLSPSSESLSTFVRSLGVEGIRVDQWFNVDVPEATNGCVYGLIFFYRWRVDRGTGQKRGAPHGEPFSSAETSGGDARDVMFVNQFVNCRSASQGVVTALLNLPNDESLSSNITLGPKLTELLSFCRPLTPAVRAAAVCSSASVHEAHNYAAKRHPSPPVRRGTSDASVSDDFWMYTVYTPGKSRQWVYELDARAKDRKLLGHVGSSVTSEEDNVNDWVGVVTESLEKRVSELRKHRVPFQLYALVEDIPCRSYLLNDIEKEKQTSAVNSGPSASVSPKDTSEVTHRTDGDTRAYEDGGDSDAHATGKDGPTWKERRRTSSKARESSGISQEEYLVVSHDYEMFFIEMLKLLGSKGELIQLVSDAARGPLVTKVQAVEEDSFANGLAETSAYEASVRANRNESDIVSNHTATSSDD